MRILVIGAGSMGSAIIEGWLQSEDLPCGELAPSDVHAVQSTRQSADRIASMLGISASDSLESQPIDDFDVIVLAVKPQVLDRVMTDLRDILDSKPDEAEMPLVISIAAGVPTSKIEEALRSESNPNPQVVRVMPNMPLQAKKGASAVAKGKNATPEQARLVSDMFSSLGYSEIVDEDMIDAVCAISGGGPAYVAYMIEALRNAGIEQGLDGDLAENLALMTVGGTFALMDEKGYSPEEMRRLVCSPGGTTLAALGAMEEGGFAESLSDGVTAAIKRAKELAQ